MSDGEGDSRLLLSDLRMPVMGGVRLAAELRKVRPGIKILFLSEFAGEAPSGEACLPKPFGTTVLLARVRAALDG